jgi:hypothetical protein
VTVQRRLRGALLAAAAALVMAGCGSLAPTQGGSPETWHPSDHLSISNFAVLVLAATDSARSVHTERVETAQGVRTEMTGDTLFDSAFYRGRLTLDTVPDGTARDASTKRSELRLLSGRVYVHVPGLVPTGKFLSLDLAGAPPAVGGLCACLFSHLEPTSTLQTMRQSLTQVDYLGRDERAGLSLEHYRLEADTAMMPGTVDATHPPTTRVYEVWLDSKHLMHRLTYSTIDKTVAVTYSHWGERVHVERPAAKQILRVPGAGATGT